MRMNEKMGVAALLVVVMVDLTQYCLIYLKFSKNLCNYSPSPPGSTLVPCAIGVISTTHTHHTHIPTPINTHQRPGLHQ